VTASNERQASAYRCQLELRRRLGLFTGVRDVLVVPDPEGRRVGSGGSTAYCLMEVLSRHLGDHPGRPDRSAWQAALSSLRVLIIHAGGDSRRLPAYGPCGKLFVPMPDDSDSALPATLFDRQIATYLALPGTGGQVVITAGDALLTFDPSLVRLDCPGITGLGCPSTPQQASRHGVYCAEPDGKVKLFLQKPSPAEQQQRGAVDRHGQSILDIGVMSLDAAAAATMLQTCGLAIEGGRLSLDGPVARAIDACGMDFYREVCCALGSQATAQHHIAAARASGSKWDDATLQQVFAALRELPLAVQVLPRCRFLHFGATAEIIPSGEQLLAEDYGIVQLDRPLSINNRSDGKGAISGEHAWVEACCISAPVDLGGHNVLTGMDVEEPLSLPEGACLDVTEGCDRRGKGVWFVRCYGVEDGFKETAEGGATFCGLALADWLAAVGATPADVWDKDAPASKHITWEARLFPAEARATGWRRWLWMFDPTSATPPQKRQWLSADRFSLAEIADLADQQAFFRRRGQLWAESISRSYRRLFRPSSDFSAEELGYLLSCADDRDELVCGVLAEAQWHHDESPHGDATGSFVFPRIIHTLGSAVEALGEGGEKLLAVLPGLASSLQPAQRTWLASLNLLPDEQTTIGDWAAAAKSAAFGYLSTAIVSSRRRRPPPPASALRADEIVWGRAPARFDMGGGWTDTPPYALERGGCVINAAVNLNSQPPIQAYARVIAEPVIHIASIDLGLRIEITELDDLLDYRQAASGFALAKAALALSGLSPEAAAWPAGASLRGMLERFGGGIELTTLAAIPKGSGLGTSSIMGIVILSVIQRVFGKRMSRAELFNGVLQLEQALTTGGGWQDQIGGAVDGVKVITTAPGLVPDARIHYVPPDMLDPHTNGGCTLLYYTGITRLAKDILQRVVGRYLDRDRATMSTLRRLHVLPPLVAEAMARKDLAAFGRLVDVAWQLKKEINADSSNPQIEELFARVRPHVYGAKMPGAGGGGFLLMVCKSPADAAAVQRILNDQPPNERARFFDFNVSAEGLAVTVC